MDNVQPKIIFHEEGSDQPFISSTWQQQLNTIIHQSKNSQDPTLLIAPQGGGKTTFFHYFLDMATPGLRKFALTASANITLEAWMHSVLHRFDIAWQGLEMSKQALSLRIEEIAYHYEETTLLLVDDAHLLTDEQLYCLLQLAQPSDVNQHPLQLLLLGEPSLDLRLFSPVVSNEFQGRINTLELAPWEVRDLNIFFARDPDFAQPSQEQIAQIFEETRGLPAYVIQEKEMLHERKAKEDPTPVRKGKTHSVVWGLVIGCVVGGGYLFLHEKGSSPQQVAVQPAVAQMLEGSQVSTLVGEPAASTELSRAESSSAHDAGGSSSSTEFTRESESAITTPVSTDAPVSIEPQSSEAMPTDQDLLDAQTLSEAQTVDPHLLLGEVPLEPVKPTLAKIEKPKKIQKVQNASPKHKTVALKQKKVVEMVAKAPIAKPAMAKVQVAKNTQKYYTLQLVGSHKAENAKQFIERHALKNKASTHRIQRDGKDWYVVVYGRYPSMADAKAAANSMPGSLKKEKIQPWVREGGTLQG